MRTVTKVLFYFLQLHAESTSMGVPRLWPLFFPFKGPPVTTDAA